jgi:PKD repeat protein
MKRAIALFLWLLSFELTAQNNVTQVEYFLDTDPGYGNAQNVQITESSDLEVNFKMPLSSLTDGFHTLFVRAKSANGKWSFKHQHPFYTSSSVITSSVIEYFIDIDPGLRKGTKIVMTDSPIQTFVADLSGIQDGFHTLYVRVCDNKGNWSFTHQQAFYSGFLVVTGPLIEYFIDSDPGLGKGTKITMTGEGEQSFVADLSGIEDGFHTLFIRVCDNMGNWSFKHKHAFYKANMPGGLFTEYFFDKDPGVGQGAIVRFDTLDNSHYEKTFVVDATKLTSGEHTLFVRTIDNYGNISFSAVQKVTICEGNLPQADFTYLDTNGEVAFTDKSKYAEIYKWEFGDGSTETIANPKHTYKVSGLYTVKQIVSNQGCGTDTSEVTIPVVILPKSHFKNICVTNDSIISLQWFGNDNGTGAYRYSIFCKTNNDEYLPLLENSLLTATTFTGNLGKSYSFYVLAKDGADILEVKESLPDTTITLSVKATISGPAKICIGQESVVYSVPNDPNYNSFIWTLPQGAIGNSSTNSITVTYGISSVSGNLTVKGHNNCGDGTESALAVTVSTFPTTAGPITGPAIVCQGQSAVVYTVPIISNATSYDWSLPVGATDTSTTNSITVNYGVSAVSGSISVKGNNFCGDGVASTLGITVNPLPEAAGPITGPGTVCQGQSSVVYSVPTIANAVTYLWTLPNGITGAGTTNSITISFGTSSFSGNITVRGINSCGEGPSSSLPVIVNPLPVTAGPITGTATVCQDQNAVVYTVPTIANATSYIWTLPVGAEGTSTTNSITVNYGSSAVSGNITVNGRNNCGDGTVSTLAITVTPLPAAAGTIIGPTTTCQGYSALVYTVPTIANATSYIWSLPDGAIGTSTTRSIIVSYSHTAVSGSITVKGRNSCGDGTASVLAVTVNPLPSAAGPITGPVDVFQGQSSIVYSTPTIDNSTSFIWTLPVGATGTSTTNSINVSYDVNAVSGNITVKGHNSCGDGLASTLAVNVNPSCSSHFPRLWVGNGYDQMNINVYSAKIDGVELETCDEIGIFDGTLCVGAGTLTIGLSGSSVLTILTSRNDGSGNGYTPGNAITYKLYDKSKNLEISNVGAVYSSELETWSTDGKFSANETAFVAMTGINIVKHEIPMIAGWNIISTYVIPSKVNLKDIFQPHIDSGKLKKVMDEAGKTVENFGIFGGWKNNIGNLSPTEGYKVNLLVADTLRLEGTLVPLPLGIPLTAGWNIISYPCTTLQDGKALVQTLIDAGKITKVMDESGKTIENFGIFGGWKNNIGNFVPGKGYKVKAASDTTFTIPANATKAAAYVPEVLASAHFTKVFVGNGTDHMNVSLVDLQTSGLRAGDEIGIFDGSYCVGSATIGIEQIKSGSISIAASANEGNNTTVNGFTIGNAVGLQLYRGSQSFKLEVETLAGSQSFEKNGSVFIKVSASNLPVVQVDNSDNLFTVYPNPFASEITIEVWNSEKTEVNVAIYNLLGQRIKNLYNAENQGQLLLKWDGTNDAGQKLVPGIYLCKVNNETKKVFFKDRK